MNTASTVPTSLAAGCSTCWSDKDTEWHRTCAREAGYPAYPTPTLGLSPPGPAAHAEILGDVPAGPCKSPQHELPCDRAKAPARAVSRCAGCGPREEQILGAQRVLCLAVLLPYAGFPFLFSDRTPGQDMKGMTSRLSAQPLTGWPARAHPRPWPPAPPLPAPPSSLSSSAACACGPAGKAPAAPPKKH